MVVVRVGWFHIRYEVYIACGKKKKNYVLHGYVLLVLGCKFCSKQSEDWKMWTLLWDSYRLVLSD